jgi:hypothetical protein
MFSPEAVAVLSNSIGSCDDDDFKMAIKTEKIIDIPVIKHEIKKPGCLKEVIEHFEKTLNRPVQPNEICVIGKDHVVFVCDFVLFFTIDFSGCLRLFCCVLFCFIR